VRSQVRALLEEFAFNLGLHFPLRTNIYLRSYFFRRYYSVPAIMETEEDLIPSFVKESKELLSLVALVVNSEAFSEDVLRSIGSIEAIVRSSFLPVPSLRFSFSWRSTRSNQIC